MAIAPLNEFKSKCVNLTTTFEDIIEVPVSVATIILDGRATNITTSGVGILSVKIIKSIDESEGIVVPDMEIPINDSLQFIEGKFVLEEGDRLLAKANSNNKLQLIVSYLETSA
jgi:hypothetical protein